MTKIIKIILLIALITCSSVSGQRIAPHYEVGTWHGFKPAAISYTFDDNCANQLVVAVPLFDKFNFKLTLFTITNRHPEWAKLQAAANNGHEIGSHTVSHPSLDSISDVLQEAEFRNSQDTINKHITRQKCMTIAYPYCASGNRNLCSECYIAARSCDGFLEPPTPRNFMYVGSINCGTLGQARTATELNAKVESAANSSSWCVFMLHGIDNDNGFSPVRSEELASHLSYVSANNNKFWVNTFGNVIRYIKERDAVRLNELSAQPRRISLQLTDSLDNSIYNYPVSIRRALPPGWKNASVKQGKINRAVQLVKLNSIDYLQFDAIPDAGTIVISKSKTKTEWLRL
jgi:peptidoglycan-N-acetylglucosamine deacetylase